MANPNWIAGEPSPNPQGRPRSVFQDYTPRAAHFLQTLTRSQILAIVSDPKKLDEYSSFDTIVLEHIANCFALDKNPLTQGFASAERERLMDRTTGKPKQALTGGDEHDAPIRLLTNSDADIIARYQQLQKPPEQIK